MATNNQGSGTGGFPQGQYGMKAAGGSSQIDARPIGRKEVGSGGTQKPGGKLGNTWNMRGKGPSKGGSR